MLAMTAVAFFHGAPSAQTRLTAMHTEGSFSNFLKHVRWSMSEDAGCSIWKTDVLASAHEPGPRKVLLNGSPWPPSAADLA